MWFLLAPFHPGRAKAARPWWGPAPAPAPGVTSGSALRVPSCPLAIKCPIWASSSGGGTQRRFLSEQRQEHPWLSCCLLLLPVKTTAKFRPGAFRWWDPHTPFAWAAAQRQRGAEALPGSRWRLQTVQPACSLPAACLQLWARSRQRATRGVGFELLPAIAGG